MYCPRCGKIIDDSDRFCKHCGIKINKNETSINSNVNKNVLKNKNNINVNINKTIPPRKKRGDVIGAINYAYENGALGSLGYYGTADKARDMINYAIQNNKSSSYSIEQTIYSITKSYKSGALGSLDFYGTAEKARDMIWKALKK